MNTNIVNTNDDYNKSSNTQISDCENFVKEWRNVDGDLDDFIFYYEEEKYLSER